MGRRKFGEYEKRREILRNGKRRGILRNEKRKEILRNGKKEIWRNERRIGDKKKGRESSRREKGE